MATYVPNATQATEPIASRPVESAALEFRTLKTSITSRVDSLQTELDAETIERTNADNAIVASISPYIDQVALVNFPNNFDLGFVSDPIAPSNFFDFGSI